MRAAPYTAIKLLLCGSRGVWRFGCEEVKSKVAGSGGTGKLAVGFELDSMRRSRKQLRFKL